MLRVSFFALLIASCATLPQVNYEKERQQILELNNRQRDNHFQKDAKAITNLSSDSFLLVDGGTISLPKREDQFNRFSAYFNSVDFIKWDDIREPVIRFSRDASVAYVAVEKIVILKGKTQSGREVTDTSHFAWISIYRKEQKEWVLDAIASTRKVK